MKKIIVALLCVVNVTCFAMNNKDTQKSIELKERKVKALELSAMSHAMQTCIEIRNNNNQEFLKYAEPSCWLLSHRYRDLVSQRINNNS